MTIVTSCLCYLRQEGEDAPLFCMVSGQQLTDQPFKIFHTSPILRWTSTFIYKFLVDDPFYQTLYLRLPDHPKPDRFHILRLLIYCYTFLGSSPCTVSLFRWNRRKVERSVSLLYKGRIFPELVIHLKIFLSERETTVIGLNICRVFLLFLLFRLDKKDESVFILQNITRFDNSMKSES